MITVYIHLEHNALIVESRPCAIVGYASAMHARRNDRHGIDARRRRVLFRRQMDIRSGKPDPPSDMSALRADCPPYKILFTEQCRKCFHIAAIKQLLCQRYSRLFPAETDQRKDQRVYAALCCIVAQRFSIPRRSATIGIIGPANKQPDIQSRTPAAWWLLLFVPAWRRMVRTDHGEALNASLGETARNLLLFGVLLTLGILIQ